MQLSKEKTISLYKLLLPGIISSLVSFSVNGIFISTSHTDRLHQDILMMQVKDAMTKASRVFEIAVPVIIGIILVIGLLGNVTVILTTVMTQRIIKHPVHSMLVLNLAVADITYLVVNAPYYIVNNITYEWVFTAAYCPFFHFASNLAMAAGIFTICSLAWMRFLALMHPFKFQKSVLPTRTGGFVVIALNWISALIIALPNVVYYRRVNVPPYNRVQCVWSEKKAEAIYAMVVMVFTYFIPFLLVTIFYIFIGREVFCFISRKTDGNRRTPQQKQASSEYRKTTIMVLCLIVAFLVCWFPHNLYVLIWISQNYTSFRYGTLRFILKMVARCMSYAHACVNPIIYTFAAPDFRNKSFSKDICPLGKRLVFAQGTQQSRRLLKTSSLVERTLVTRFGSTPT